MYSRWKEMHGDKLTRGTKKKNKTYFAVLLSQMDLGSVDMRCITVKYVIKPSDMLLDCVRFIVKFTLCNGLKILEN